MNREIDPVGLAILIVLLVIGNFVLRRVWRFVRSLLPSRADAKTARRAASPSRDADDPATAKRERYSPSASGSSARTSTLPADRMARFVSRPSG